MDLIKLYNASFYDCIPLYKVKNDIRFKSPYNGRVGFFSLPLDECNTSLLKNIINKYPIINFNNEMKMLILPLKGEKYE